MTAELVAESAKLSRGMGRLAQVVEVMLRVGEDGVETREDRERKNTDEKNKHPNNGRVLGEEEVHEEDVRGFRGDRKRGRRDKLRHKSLAE